MSDADEPHLTQAQLEGLQLMGPWLRAKHDLDGISGGLPLALDPEAPVLERREVMERWIVAFGRLVNAEEDIRRWLLRQDDAAALKVLEADREAHAARAAMAHKVELMLLELRNIAGG